jgi:sugar/nucleoside kinase (ribokinase family)
VDTVMAPGGSAANTIYGLAMLGDSTAFVGKLGDDDHGAFYRRRFEKENICCNRFKYCPNSHTGTCISLVTPDSERTMRTHLGAAAALNQADLLEEDFHHCKHVHVEGYLLFNPELAEAVLAHAQAAGAVISLDLASFEVVNIHRDKIADLLDRYVDMVFANEDECQAFCGTHDPETACQALATHCDLVAVKHGADGAWVYQNGEMVHAPATRVDAIDTTGAGDLWAAGFLHAHYQGLSPEACGRAGAILGAEVVQILGARIPTETWPQVRATISTL